MRALELLDGTGVDRPSLSFARQPDFRELINSAIDASKQNSVVTLFCGAGASIDSDMPTWRELIQRLAEKISNQDLARLLIAEDVDLPRRVELILAAFTSGSPESVAISEALYRDSGRQAPGPLAASIAQIAKSLAPNVNIVTTNYDDRLELALARVAADGEKVESFGLNSIAEWKASKSKYKVLHLHGYLPSNQLAGVPPIEPIVLSESSYVYVGRQVQDFVEECLESSTVLFIGTSMTDPSVVRPLHRTVQDGKRSGPRPFALWVPKDDWAGDESAIAARRGFTKLQLRYLRQPLNIGPIVLKSYGQMAQCIAEVVTAIRHPDAYLSDDPDTSLRYGFRFHRTMQAVGVKLDIDSGEFAPSGDSSRRLSEGLAAPLMTGGKIDAFRKKCEMDYLPSLEARLLPGDYFTDEHWALALWLRTHRPEPRLSPYELFLAGSSSHATRDGRALGQRAQISMGSRFVAAQAAYSGQVRGDSRRPSRPGPDRNVSPWLSYFAVPLSVAETDLSGSNPEASTPVTIGAIVLQSSRRNEEPSELDLSRAPRDLSLISFLDPVERTELYDLLHEAAMDLLAATP